MLTALPENRISFPSTYVCLQLQLQSFWPLGHLHLGAHSHTHNFKFIKFMSFYVCSSVCSVGLVRWLWLRALTFSRGPSLNFQHPHDTLFQGIWHPHININAGKIPTHIKYNNKLKNNNKQKPGDGSVYL